ncbi:myoferlin isoform X2 [Nematostella vectensis]|uniref:myoferlin isoform X2 n=1 Tax=Nematostella vectensis TaxID=45351 RepID=UPI0020776553|nr:myoferlin isoform X2 [Nematostella vectensis]
MLRVVVKSAVNLPNVDFRGESDPYVKLSFRGEEKKTKVIDDNLNPVWDEDNEFEWSLGGGTLSLDDTLKVSVKDWDLCPPRKLLGQVTIALKELLKTKDYALEKEYPLVDSSNRATPGSLNLRIEFKLPGGRSPADLQPSSPGVELEYMDELDAGVGKEGTSEEDDKEDNDDQGKDREHRKRRRRRRHATRKRSSKPQHYQVRVKIHEGRQIPGTNIHPLVRVSVGNKKQSTSVKRSTNSPTYNQTLFFNFHASEAELFDELMTLEVFNSRTFLSDSLLGFFESDIGTLYELPDHAFLRKWVLLTGAGVQESEDEGEDRKTRSRGRDGGPAGYLKVTAMVLGPGDEPPVASKLDSVDSANDDIESNLLLPAGVRRQQAVFQLRVYFAEDLPQMDSGWSRRFRKWFLPGSAKESAEERKKSVDPYLTFSFCGKQIQTKTQHHENNPVFNQMLQLPVMLPSMCENIKLQLWDWDSFSKHDCIATAYLPLSEISGKSYGEDFFPRYGPCYLNFYGSPREFQLISDEHEDLNKGIGEGVAYRGRVMLELTTEDTSDVSSTVSTLGDDDAFIVQPYLKQDQFKLFACFYEASMVCKGSAPVEFEVSIGNFGNILDETVAACNTPPTNPIYDGCYYHYLPWFHQKPCVCLDCDWENIAFRIEPLNLLSNTCDRLEEALNHTKEKIKNNPIGDMESVSLVYNMLEKVVRECSYVRQFLKDTLPKLPRVRNKSDMKVQALRDFELRGIVRDATDEIQKRKDEEMYPSAREVIPGDDVNLSEVENFLLRLRGLVFEPQNSMPDVIIWMISGGKRVAYHRVPARDIMYSPHKHASGKWCGKPMEVFLKYPGKRAQDVQERPELPGLVRVELWLGTRLHRDQWSLRKSKEGEFAVFAETYENEVFTMVKWTKSGTTTRPHYSNASGDLELHKDKFLEPANWHFEGDWTPSIDKSAMYARDWGMSVFVEEIYEHQSRNIIGGGWDESSTWKDAFDEPCSTPSRLPAPDGWVWKSEGWTVDTNRAVDAGGWEYSVGEELGGIYSRAQKSFHRVRRRRLVRTRELKDERAASKRLKLEQLAEEGWEYAPSFLHKFHIKPHKRDFVRRKRLLRKLKPNGSTLPELPPKLCIKLKVKEKKKKKKKKGSDERETLMREEEQEGHLPVAPRMLVEFREPYKFQLWVYMYQARDLLGLDDSGMSDPYVRVCFSNQSQKTEMRAQTLSPNWDQTLVFRQVELCDRWHNIKRYTPSVVMEIYDKDPVGKDDFMGRCLIKPLLQDKDGAHPPSLSWYTVQRGDSTAGEVLAACELFLDDGKNIPSLPSPKNPKAPPVDYIWPVRDALRPQLRRIAVEVLCWGVRNMKAFRGTDVNSPMVEFEWGDKTFRSGIMANAKKNPNFPHPILDREIVTLPVEPYTPAMSIRVFDKRAFGSKPLVGVHSLPSLKHFEREIPKPGTLRPDRAQSPASPMSLTPRQASRRVATKAGEEFDWWSKYYFSLKYQSKQARHVRRAKADTTEYFLGQLKKQFSGDDGSSGDHMQYYEKSGYDVLTIFPKELEKMGYEELQDFVSSFPLKRGKAKHEDEEDEGVVGELKASFRVYPLEEDTRPDDVPRLHGSHQETHRKWPLKCIVRVYVICGMDLQSQDTDGFGDPYLVVSIGKKEFSTRKDYKKKTLNPVFGEMFEFHASIPLSKDLKITVMDYDRLSRDDLIGETTIDLEQRLLSGYHATCGLPKTYFKSGPYAWRDSKTPKEILREVCLDRGLNRPDFYHKGDQAVTVVVGEDQFNIEDLDDYQLESNELGSSEQRLSLHALHAMGMVPEHVETRPLYSPLQPRIEQGKLQLWVDIFPCTEGSIKPPIEIEPRKPKDFVLRVIIWDTTDVELQETSITGEKMSDIYLKGWLEEIDEKLKTDVHYRSLSGDGNFNWRMEFPFSFLTIEKKLHVSKKKLWGKCEEGKVDAKLKIQIWENDKFSPDDFLGTRSLPLHRLPKPCSNSRWCGTKYDPGVRQNPDDDFVDLFTLHTHSIRGWWACWQHDSPSGKPKGKVDMSLEILTAEEAKARPVGLGRSEPNQHPYLPEPEYAHFKKRCWRFADDK